MVAEDLDIDFALQHKPQANPSHDRRTGPYLRVIACAASPGGIWSPDSTVNVPKA